MLFPVDFSTWRSAHAFLCEHTIHTERPLVCIHARESTRIRATRLLLFSFLFRCFEVIWCTVHDAVSLFFLFSHQSHSGDWLCVIEKWHADGFWHLLPTNYNCRKIDFICCTWFNSAFWTKVKLCWFWNMNENLGYKMNVNAIYLFIRLLMFLYSFLLDEIDTCHNTSHPLKSFQMGQRKTYGKILRWWSGGILSRGACNKSI